jgi:hypothetical protein
MPAARQYSADGSGRRSAFGRGREAPGGIAQTLMVQFVDRSALRNGAGGLIVDIRRQTMVQVDLRRSLVLV